MAAAYVIRCSHMLLFTVFLFSLHTDAEWLQRMSLPLLFWMQLYGELQGKADSKYQDGNYYFGNAERFGKETFLSP